jgi:hypothetical protein
MKAQPGPGGCRGCLARASGGGLVLPLAVLFLQTTIPLLIRHTRKHDPNAQPPVVLYHPASVTLLAEVTKCVGAFVFMYRQTRRALQQQRGGGRARGIVSMHKALWETGRRFVAAIWRLRWVEVRLG